MKELVMGVINISGQAAIIFVVLLAVRGIFALGRVPKKYACGLWAILFIRLLLPIQLEARWGLMPQESGLARMVENMVIAAGQGEQRPGNSAGDIRYVEGQKVPTDWQSMFGEQNASTDRQNRFENPDIPAGRYDMSEGEQDAQYARLRDTARHAEKSRFTGGGAYTAGQGGVPAGGMMDIDFRQLSLWTAVAGIWIAGSVLFIGYGFFSYFILKGKLCCSVRLEGWGDGIYLADGIETPFVLGFIAPRIYLPSNIASRNYPYVIAHERIHIRRRDHLFKLGAYLLTCLYWFHPLVWAGFILMGHDMEMSCDEAVLRRMDSDCRGEYADSLLELSCGRHYPAAAPLAFGEGDTRGRIKHIMGYRKAAAAVVTAAAALTGILAVVLLASPREAAAEDGRSLQISSLSEEEYSPQDSEPMELKEGDSSGESMERAEDGGKQEFIFQVAYREVIPCPVPVMTGDTSLGADGAILDYVDEDKVIFHGYFGLYVYSASTGETIGAVDLRALGCGDTQGDNTCQILVSRDGAKVYFYPLGGIEEVEGGDEEHTIYSYVYDVAGGRLLIASWDLEQSGEPYEEMELSRLIGEELSESRVMPVAELERTAGEQGFFSWYGMLFERDGEQSIGYLKSATGTLEDLVYVQLPVHGETPASVQDPENGQNTVEGGGIRREAVRLFGADGQGISTVSYGQEPTQITIDGMTYDLCRVMTEYRLGDETIESPQGNDLVNAITGLQCVDGLWIAEGHINPSRSTYSFYDPAAGEWVCHIVGTSLTWSSRDERVALWEGNREDLLSTVIYALDNRVYSLRDGLLAFLPWEQADRNEAGLSPDEIICGLYRQGDEITVEIGSTLTEERRTVQFFLYERSESGPLKLE